MKNSTLQLEKDYLLYKSGQQTFTPIPHYHLVFVGYGIIAPEFDYNDYQSVNVEGKIVVFFDGEPESNDPDFFNGQATNYLQFDLISKQRTSIFKRCCRKYFDS